MKQNRQLILIAVLSFVVCVGGPFTLARRRAKALDVKTASVKAETKAVKTQIELGKSVKKSRSQYDEMLKTVRVAMPSDNDLKGAINQLHELAEAAGLQWQSVSTGDVVWTVSSDADAAAAATAAAAAAAKADDLETDPKAKNTKKASGAVATTVAQTAALPVGGFSLNIEVAGPRDSILNYLKLIRTQPNPVRLFVVDTVTMAIAEGELTGGVGNATITLKSTAFGVPTKASDAVGTTPEQASASTIAAKPGNVAQPTQTTPTVAPTTVAPTVPPTTVAPQQQTSASSDPPVEG